MARAKDLVVVFILKKKRERERAARVSRLIKPQGQGQRMQAKVKAPPTF